MMVGPGQDVSWYAGDSPMPASKAVHGAFQSMLRDLEKDYWRDRPDGMATPVRREPDLPQADSEHQLRPLAELEAPAPHTGQDAQMPEPHQSTAGALQLRLGVNHLLGARQSEPDGLAAAQPVQRRDGDAGHVSSERPSADGRPVEQLFKRSFAGHIPEQAYHVARMHVYRVEDGVGVRYRDARLTGQDMSLLASQIRNGLGWATPIREIYINARCVEFRGK